MGVDIATAVEQAESVRKARAGEVPRVAAALASAFETDPAFGWVLHDAPGRRAVLERGFTVLLDRLWMAQDECYTTADAVGAAVWERPGEWKVPPLVQLRMGPAVMRAYGRHAPRLMRANLAMESGHPREEHYYLPFVGVVPGWQGRGIGAALLRPVLDRCDRDRVPAYLEASSPRNRVLYQRQGFEVTEEFRLGRGSPPLWRMWRVPR
jgi:GNAT superfamily N-acetyltransferase